MRIKGEYFFSLDPLNPSLRRSRLSCLTSSNIWHDFQEIVHFMITNEKKYLKRIITHSIRLSTLRRNIISRFPVTLFSSKKRHTFFGYYDRTSFSLDNNKILALAIDCDNRPLIQPLKAEIGFFYIDNPNEFHRIGETTTWCWQQGCRQMWFPKDENRLVMYNKIVNDNYGSVVHDINSKKIINEFNFPIYDVNKNGTSALTLNFSRLHRVRPGYGYMNIDDNTKNDLCPENDGVWICDLLDSKKNLIINLKMLSNLEPDDTMDKALHYINHLCFNPGGSRFLFFHLWIKDNKRYSRGITSDLEGNNIHIVNNRGFVSHYSWKNNQELLIYSAINQQAQYYLYHDLSDEVQTVSEDLLNSDGHPTFFNEGEWIVTDTYPSRFSREQSLIIFNIEKNSLHKIAKIYSPTEYTGEVRCDLHPRVSRNNRYICIDAPTKNGRGMMIFDIDKLLHE